MLATQGKARVREARAECTNKLDCGRPVPIRSDPIRPPDQIEGGLRDPPDHITELTCTHLTNAS